MDDIITPLNDDALNELAAEGPEPIPPPQPSPAPAQPIARPLGRHVFHNSGRNPAMAQPQPLAPPRPPMPQPTLATAQPQPLAQPMPQPMAQPQPTLATPAAAPVSSAMPGFQTMPQPRPPISQNGPVPVGVSASSLGLNAKTAAKLPKGVYVIVGLTVLDLAISFFSSNTSPIYSFAIVVDLLLAVGLLTKLDLARRVSVIFQVVNVLLVILVVIGLMGTESKLNQLTGQYNDAVAKASAHASPQQEVAIDNLNTQMNSQRKQIGKAIGIDYVRSSLSLFVSAGIVLYLTRPGVKTAFH